MNFEMEDDYKDYPEYPCMYCGVETDRTVCDICTKLQDEADEHCDDC